jgi:hypothetical protein
VARLDSFDITACPKTWFDVDNDQNGWWDRDLVDCRGVPPPPPPPPPPRPPRRALTRRSGVGGGGGGSARQRVRPPCEPIECLPDKIYVHFDDPEELVEIEADYALMTVTEGAVVRALASGFVTHFCDARGRQALKLEADDGTNYYYADLSCYIGAVDRRVEVGEIIAKSAREAVPEITGGPQAKVLPVRAGDVSAPPKLRVVAPVFVEPPAPPPAPKRMWVKLIPIAPPPASPPQEWAVMRAPESGQSTAIAYLASLGALAALLYALSFAPKRPKPLKRRPKPKKRRK